MVTLKDQNQATIYTGWATNAAGVNTFAIGLGTFTNPLSLEITNNNNNQTFEIDNITLTQDGIAGVSYYTAQLVSAQDYYPFGTTLPGRTFQDDRFSGYRFTFNGKENDSETYGDGNAYDFGARIYDSRLGRWLSLDPLFSIYPDLSPYCFVGNRPLMAIDPDGKYIYYVNSNGEFRKATRAMVRTMSGSEIYLKYLRSKTTDVYIGVSNFGDNRTASAMAVSNAESDGNNTGITVNGDSRLTISSSVDSEAKNAFSTFKDVDFSKSKGRIIHLVSVSNESLKENDEYTMAEAIYHELKAHIEDKTGNAKKDHDKYGKTATGLYMERLILDGHGNRIPDENGDDLREIVPKNSPAGKMVKQLIQLKQKDEKAKNN
jgi:RHS repeat-associated protein